MVAAGRVDPVRSAVAANLGLVLMVVIWGAMFPAIERILATWDVISATAARTEQKKRQMRSMIWSDVLRVGLD